MLKLLFASPWFIYIKVGLAATALAGAGYLAWTVRGAFADEQRREAVNEAVASINKQLEVEKTLRLKYEKLADTRLDALLKSISILQEDFRSVSGSIAKERTNNPEFYEQPLPAVGYEQWKRARQLVESSNSPATQP